MRGTAAMLLVGVVAACGTQPGASGLAAAFGRAGMTMTERAIDNGRTVWESAPHEDALIIVSGEPVEWVYLQLPPLPADVSAPFPGSRYLDVLDEGLLNGLRDWIAEEADGRAGDDWVASRRFGAYHVKITSNSPGPFEVHATTQEAGGD